MFVFSLFHVTHEVPRLRSPGTSSLDVLCVKWEYQEMKGNPLSSNSQKSEFLAHLNEM